MRVATLCSIFFCTIIVCFSSLPGCGKKGNPIALTTVMPEKIKDLFARPQGRVVILSWGIPKKNVDDSPLRDLKGFKILRSEVDLEEGCLECPKRFSLLYDIDYKTYLMNNPQATTISFTDKELTLKKVYTYRVASYNSDNHLSPESNTQEIYWSLPTLPPQKARAELKEKSVVLSWEEPPSLEDGSPLEGLVGYTVYRRLFNETYSPTPLNKELITTRACRDSSIEMDKDYLYLVRAVRQSGKTLIESEAGEEIAINTTDRVPPESPTGLIAIPTKTGMMLRWNESKESDLKGYNLYRKAEGGGELRRLNASLLPRAFYLDSSVEDKMFYTYTVTAVDDSTRVNESNPSEEVTMRFRY